MFTNFMEVYFYVQSYSVYLINKLKENLFFHISYLFFCGGVFILLVLLGQERSSCSVGIYFAINFREENAQKLPDTLTLTHIPTWPGHPARSHSQFAFGFVILYFLPFCYFQYSSEPLFHHV